MPTDKRQRQKQARQERLEAERKAARRAASRRRLITGVGVAVAVFAVLALYSFLSTGDDDDASTTTTTAVPATTASTEPPADQPPITAPAGAFPTELQSTDLTVGDGAEAAVGQTITVDYVGIHASNGEVFESTYGGEPAQFTLDAGGLIEGWVQGIPGMKVGGRRQLLVPSDLAYGEAGKGDIGPNENLVFVIDLVAVS